MKSKLVFVSEPVLLNGEGFYNLNVVKEERVTESFLGLDEEVRGCQNHESQEDCQTRFFIKTALEKCECLPFNIRTAEWKNKVWKFVVLCQCYINMLHFKSTKIFNFCFTNRHQYATQKDWNVLKVSMWTRKIACNLVRQCCWE